MRKSTYIGVTGYMSGEQRKRSLSVFSEGNETARNLMTGVLVSSKTLRGETNNYPWKYPLVEDIRDIFEHYDAWALNLIHYSTDEPDTLLRQLLFLTGIGGPQLHGFQLNMAWPSIEYLRCFHKITGGKYRIVLQIGDNALVQIDNSPSELVRKITPYADDGCIEDILVDSSGGRGLPFDQNKALDFLQEFKRAKLPINFGVAGGLGPDTVKRLEPVLDRYPFINFDAEGHISSPGSGMNMRWVEIYLRQSMRMVADAEAK